MHRFYQNTVESWLLKQRVVYYLRFQLLKNRFFLHIHFTPDYLVFDFVVFLIEASLNPMRSNSAAAPSMLLKMRAS